MLVLCSLVKRETNQVGTCQLSIKYRNLVILWKNQIATAVIVHISLQNANLIK